MITAEEFAKGWKNFLGCLNFDLSALNAEAIMFMNEMPAQVWVALRNHEITKKLKEGSSSCEAQKN